MHISLAWLARHVDLDGVDLDVLYERFTLSVAELEGVTRYQDESRAVVGQVVSAVAVPDTKLHQCRVDIGERVLDIVCGAANVASGQRVAVVLPGGKIQGREVVARKVHGLPSEGVLASEIELGIGPDESGILVLGEPATLGQRIATLGAVVDSVLEIDNKSLTHRPDLWGHRGIAREVAALFGRRLRPLDLELSLGQSKALPVEISAPAACKRYIALGLRGFTIASSPLWLRVLLHRVGTRPINNVVDATNFAMLDLGNPLHAFDRRTLSGDRIVVRHAREGESIRTLDGIDRALIARDLVIADGERPVALAGIMGGEHSGIEATTTDVLLEAANFDAATIRVTGQRLGLRTEASARFEKSLDPKLAELTARAFTRLLQELSPGTQAYSALTSAGEADPPQSRITLRLDRVRKRLGVDLSTETIRGYLSAIEFDVRDAGVEAFDVGVPSFRATKDITQEVDLIEEVGRCHGYNNIPPAPPPVVLRSPDENRRKRFERAARSYLTEAAGFDEVLTYSFSSEAFLEKIGAKPAARSLLKNPLSSDMIALRTELAPHLIEALSKNAQSYERIGVFELGRIFRPTAVQGELPDQPTHLAALVAVAGAADEEAALFFELKGILEGLFAGLGRQSLRLEKAGVRESWVHPSRQARVFADSTELGYLAELHPVVLSRLDRSFRAALFELDLDRLRALPDAVSLPQPPPQFPATFRDFALVVPEAVSADALAGAIRAASPLIAAVDFQSLYRGTGIEEGHKCLAWSVTFRHADRTLTDTEVQAASDAIITAVTERAGGRLR